MMRLLSWIPENKLCHSPLNMNENAIDYIKQNGIIISIGLISFNPGAICFLNNPKYVYYSSLAKNHNAIQIIKKHIHSFSKFELSQLSANSNALHLLTLENINWKIICQNTNPRAIELIKENIDNKSLLITELCWERLSENPGAIDFILEYPEQIIWPLLCKNPHPKALQMIKQKLKEEYMDQIKRNMTEAEIIEYRRKIEYDQPKDKIIISKLCNNTNPDVLEILESRKENINWNILCLNPIAIKMLEQNQDRIKWYWLSFNHSIFEYDYDIMAKERMTLLREELMMKTLHPSRIEKWLDAGLSIDDL